MIFYPVINLDSRIKYMAAKYSFVDYIPLFLILCFSGNPLFTSAGYSKSLLIFFSALFILYTLLYINVKSLNKALAQLGLVVSIIIILSVFQRFSLGSVSYPGVIALILKIALGMFLMLLYHSRNINMLDLYVKTIAFLAKVSLPLFLLNYFVFAGLDMGIPHVKTLFLYTAYDLPKEELRNAGMFWEAGAFAGYLVLALLFITVINKKFTIGSYRKETFWIITGLLTTMSTTGFLVLALMIFIYIFQNYKYGRIIVLPVVFFASLYAYNNLAFLNAKIEEQYDEAAEMESTDVSNTRFGSLNMDMIYIMDQPYTGNGLDSKTRYRFHPWIDGDIGHGNGMSNFLVWWGIPFFLFWVFCVYKFAAANSGSIKSGILFTIILLLVLQGEQFLNFPIFLMFFTAPLFVFMEEEEEDSEEPEYEELEYEEQ